jgi:hypothetical protein
MLIASAADIIGKLDNFYLKSYFTFVLINGYFSNPLGLLDICGNSNRSLVNGNWGFAK